MTSPEAPRSSHAQPVTGEWSPPTPPRTGEGPEGAAVPARHPGEVTTPPGPTAVSPLTTPEPQPQPQQADLPSIPGYVLVRRLGKGGMGEVYEAINRLGRRFALKVIRRELCHDDLKARFRREAGTLQELDHPHIARIFEYNEVEGVPYFTMRLLTGGTLLTRMDELRSDPQRAIGMISVVADAVGYLHQRNLLHRDLKPANILFDEEDRPCIGDFGLVKPLAGNLPDAPDSEGALPDSVADLTGYGSVLGTLHYMSPEQLLGDSDRVGPWSDVWALGVILYQLLSGQLPFQGRDQHRLLEQIERTTPPPIRTGNAALDHKIECITRKCFARHIDNRYPSAWLLAEDLKAGSEPAGKSRPGVGRRRGLLGLLGVLLLAGLASLLFSPQRASDPDPAVVLSRLQGKLARGEVVEWVGGKGFPLWHRVVAGNEYVLVRELWDGSFTADTQSFALIELCPDPPREDFVIEAMVRQNGNILPTSRVGLYTFRQSHGPGNSEHVFASWSFQAELDEFAQNEKPPQGFLAGRAEFHLQNVNWDPPRPVVPRTVAGVRHKDFLTRAASAETERWHRLTLRVNARGLETGWEGQDVARVPWPRLNLFFRELELPAERQPRLNPRGGVGLYVFRSSASFKNVVVRVTPTH